MFDRIHSSTDSNDTLFNPGSTRDADFAAPLPDAGALLAAVGMPAHAIREVLASQDWTHPGKVEAPYTVCIASASNLTGLVKSSVECRRTGL